MGIAAMNRLLGLEGILLAMVLLAGCASTNGSPGGDGSTTTDVDFSFSAEPVPAGGSPTNIVVKPLVPTAGLYGGGNARIESMSASERNFIVWKSTRPFWIRFESMKSNRGNGGNSIGPENFTKSKDDGTGPYQYYHRQELPSGGGKTQSAKYYLTFAGVDPSNPKRALGFELDPVIIVDR
jgi:hypothetical protein